MSNLNQNNIITFYNAVYEGDVNIPPIPEELESLELNQENISEEINISSSIPQTPIENMLFTNFNPTYFFINNTEHYLTCKNMLISDNYKKYTEDYYLKITVFINNLKKSTNKVRLILNWETQEEITSLDNIDDALEIIISTGVINTIIDIAHLIKENFNEESDISFMLKYTQYIDNWFMSLEQNNNTLNIENITSITSYITVLSLLLLPIKYISFLLDKVNLLLNETLLLKTLDINYNAKNLLLLTFIDKEIRNKIIKKLNKQVYTNSLLKTINILDMSCNYIDILFLSGNLIDIIEELDLNIFININFFDNNSILHLLILSLTLCKNISSKIEIIQRLSNNKNFIENIYRYAFKKNNFDMIPIEFSNYDYHISYLLQKIYFYNPLESLLNFSHDTNGVTHAMLNDFISEITDKDIYNYIHHFLNLYNKEFKYTIKYNKIIQLINNEQRDRSYISIKRILNICIDNKINEDHFVDLIPFTTDAKIDSYVNYINNTYSFVDNFNRINLNNLDNNTQEPLITDKYIYMFDKCYNIWQNIEFFHVYKYNSINKIDDDDIYLTTIMNYYTVITKILERRIVEKTEYIFIYNVILSLIDKYGFKQDIVNLLFLLEKSLFTEDNYDTIFKLVNMEILYLDIITCLEKKIKVNQELFDYCINNFIKYIKTPEEFILLIETATNKQQLYCSDLPLELKFGKYTSHLYYHFTHHYNINYLLPLTQNYDEYKNKYAKTITNVLMDYTNLQSFITEDIIKTFKIDEDFIRVNKLRERFIDIHTLFTEYSSYNFIYWYDIFIKMIKIPIKYFNNNICEKIFNNKLNYNLKRIWIKYGYLKESYIPNYLEYFNMFAGQILTSNDFKNFIKSGAIQLKDYMLATNITKLLTRNIDIDFLFNEKKYIDILKDGIENNNKEVLNLIINNKIKIQTLINLTINQLLPENILLETHNNKKIICNIYEHIKTNDKENLVMLDKLCKMTVYNNIDILNITINFIFTSYTLNTATIKEIFEELQLEKLSIFSYISSLKDINNVYTLKNLLYFIISSNITENIKLVLSVIINNNLVFTSNTPNFSITEKINLLINNNIIIRKNFIINLLNTIKSRIDCSSKLILKLIILNLSKNIIFEITDFNNIINYYPEIITLFYNENCEKILDDIINDETKLNYLLENHISNINLQNDILKKLKELDYNLYIETLLLFDSSFVEKINNLDENIINSINNPTLLNKILIKYSIKPNIICEFKNIFNRYTLIDCSTDIILKYIDYYTYDKLLELDITNKHNIFSFFINKEVIEFLLSKFRDTNILELKDNFGQTILTYCIKLGLTNIIENMFIQKITLNTFIFLCKDENIDINLLSKIIIINNPNILNEYDSEYNSGCYYLMKYKPNLFKTIYVLLEINLNKHNINNETIFMSLIKESNNEDIIDLFKWLINNEIKLYPYVDNDNGSILTYSLKYNLELFNMLINIDNLFKTCEDIHDMVNNLIDINSNNLLNNNVKLNLLQIATILSYDGLNILLKKYKIIKLKKLFTNTIQINNMNYNLLLLAIFNNPENLEVLLNHELCDIKYINDTLDLIENIEVLIDIQPASYYYLIKNNKVINNNTLSSRLILEQDEHYYGFNYKNKLLSNKIDSIKHYIKGKQYIDITNNIKCNICEIFYPNIIITDCKHRLCISCAIKTKDCQYCRGNATDDKKVLI